MRGWSCSGWGFSSSHPPLPHTNCPEKQPGCPQPLSRGNFKLGSSCFENFPLPSKQTTVLPQTVTQDGNCMFSVFLGHWMTFTSYRVMSPSPKLPVAPPCCRMTLGTFKVSQMCSSNSCVGGAGHGHEALPVS